MCCSHLFAKSRPFMKIRYADEPLQVCYSLVKQFIKTFLELMWNKFDSSITMLSYAQIKLSVWLFQVPWLFLANQSTLFQRSKVTLLSNFCCTSYIWSTISWCVTPEDFLYERASFLKVSCYLVLSCEMLQLSIWTISGFSGFRPEMLGSDCWLHRSCCCKR